MEHSLAIAIGLEQHPADQFKAQLLDGVAIAGEKIEHSARRIRSGAQDRMEMARLRLESGLHAAEDGIRAFAGERVSPTAVARDAADKLSSRILEGASTAVREALARDYAAVADGSLTKTIAQEMDYTIDSELASRQQAGYRTLMPAERAAHASGAEKKVASLQATVDLSLHTGRVERQTSLWGLLRKAVSVRAGGGSIIIMNVISNLKQYLVDGVYVLKTAEGEVSLDPAMMATLHTEARDRIAAEIASGGEAATALTVHSLMELPVGGDAGSFVAKLEAVLSREGAKEDRKGEIAEMMTQISEQIAQLMPEQAGEVGRIVEMRVMEIIRAEHTHQKISIVRSVLNGFLRLTRTSLADLIPVQNKAGKWLLQRFSISEFVGIYGALSFAGLILAAFGLVSLSSFALPGIGAAILAMRGISVGAKALGEFATDKGMLTTYHWHSSQAEKLHQKYQADPAALDRLPTGEQPQAFIEELSTLIGLLMHDIEAHPHDQRLSQALQHMFDLKRSAEAHALAAQSKRVHSRVDDATQKAAEHNTEVLAEHLGARVAKEQTKVRQALESAASILLVGAKVVATNSVEWLLTDLRNQVLGSLVNVQVELGGDAYQHAHGGAGATDRLDSAAKSIGMTRDAMVEAYQHGDIGALVKSSIATQTERMGASIASHIDPAIRTSISELGASLQQKAAELTASISAEIEARGGIVGIVTGATVAHAAPEGSLAHSPVEPAPVHPAGLETPAHAGAHAGAQTGEHPDVLSTRAANTAPVDRSVEFHNKISGALHDELMGLLHPGESGAGEKDLSVDGRQARYDGMERCLEKLLDQVDASTLSTAEQARVLNYIHNNPQALLAAAVITQEMPVIRGEAGNDSAMLALLQNASDGDVAHQLADVMGAIGQGGSMHLAQGWSDVAAEMSKQALISLDPHGVQAGLSEAMPDALSARAAEISQPGATAWDIDMRGHIVSLTEQIHQIIPDASGNANGHEFTPDQFREFLLTNEGRVALTAAAANATAMEASLGKSGAEQNALELLLGSYDHEVHDAGHAADPLAGAKEYVRESPLAATNGFVAEIEHQAELTHRMVGADAAVLQAQDTMTAAAGGGPATSAEAGALMQAKHDLEGAVAAVGHEIVPAEQAVSLALNKAGIDVTSNPTLTGLVNAFEAARATYEAALKTATTDDDTAAKDAFDTAEKALHDAPHGRSVQELIHKADNELGLLKSQGAAQAELEMVKAKETEAAAAVTTQFKDAADSIIASLDSLVETTPGDGHANALEQATLLRDQALAAVAATPVEAQTALTVAHAQLDQLQALVDEMNTKILAAQTRIRELAQARDEIPANQPDLKVAAQAQIEEAQRVLNEVRATRTVIRAGADGAPAFIVKIQDHITQLEQVAAATPSPTETALTPTVTPAATEVLPTATAVPSETAVPGATATATPEAAATQEGATAVPTSTEAPAAAEPTAIVGNFLHTVGAVPMEVLVRTNVVLDGSEDGDPRTISLDDNVIRLNQVLAAHHQLIPAESEIVLPSNMSEVQKDSIWNLELFAQSLARQFDDTAEIAVTEKRNGLDDLTFAEFFPGWDQHVVDAIREFSTTENDGSRTDALTALVAVVTNTDKGQVPQEVWDAAQGGKDILGVLKDPQDRHLFAGNDVAIDQALKVLKGADPDQLNIIFQALGYADSSSNAMLKILGWVAGGALSLASGAGSFLLGKRWLSQTSDGGFGSGDEVSAKSQGL